jgi:predicted amidohydrolase YtcJ
LALEMLLKAFERTMDKGNPLRHQIVHAGNLTAGQIDRVAKLGLYVCSQANFVALLVDGFMEAFGPVRSRELDRFKTLLQKGVRLGFSSDCPVADPNPLIGLRDAICRKTGKGQDFAPAECLTAEQAVSLYTREAAHFSFEEGERGTLKEGKVADLVVLDKDPLQTSPEAIPGIKVKMTMVGGRVVYDAR